MRVELCNYHFLKAITHEDEKLTFDYPAVKLTFSNQGIIVSDKNTFNTAAVDITPQQDSKSVYLNILNSSLTASGDITIKLGDDIANQPLTEQQKAEPNMIIIADQVYLDPLLY